MKVRWERQLAELTVDRENDYSFDIPENQTLQAVQRIISGLSVIRPQLAASKPGLKQLTQYMIVIDWHAMIVEVRARLFADG